MGEVTVTGRTRRSSVGSVRVLNHRDLAASLSLLSAQPIENVFVAARVRAGGIEASGLGCPIWGYEVGGVLRSLCHAGSNLVPVNADQAAVAAYAEYTGGERMCSSIIGPSDVAMGLYHQLSAQWGTGWSETRELRPRQPVMAIQGDPAIPADPRVRRVTLQHWDAYYEAAVQMYTEEVGVSPLLGNPAGYRFYVRQLITSGRAFAIFDGDRVVFKADLGSVSGTVSQVQGVWVDPELRGQGLAAPAMAGVVRLARTISPVVSLYVNDFNLPALATYRRAGFEQVGEFATVLY